MVLCKWGFSFWLEVEICTSFCQTNYTYETKRKRQLCSVCVCVRPPPYFSILCHAVRLIYCSYVNIMVVHSSCSWHISPASSALLWEKLLHLAASPLHCQWSHHLHPTLQSVSMQDKRKIWVNHCNNWEFRHNSTTKKLDSFVTCFTCSGVDIPNPTATGLSVTCKDHEKLSEWCSVAVHW